jgi:hypothetical protein
LLLLSTSPDPFTVGCRQLLHEWGSLVNSTV